MSKTALITGISGQDGAYLAHHLLSHGYVVWGALRRSSLDNQWRLKELGILEEIHLIDLELLEPVNIINVIRMVKPNEIYNLAAQSFVGVSFTQPIYTSHVNALSTIHILEAIRAVDSNIRFYQASTSEMFGNNGDEILDEGSRFSPMSPYATAKLFSHWMTINYRHAYDLFACCGILFNHESPLRGIDFVTRKITYGLARLRKEEIPYVDLDAKRDWGHAKDYVRGMYLMLQQEEADEYVLASNTSHSVRDFINIAAPICGWSPEWVGEGSQEACIDTVTGTELVRVNPKYFRPSDVRYLRGDSSKAKRVLNWSPNIDFESLVVGMMEEDLKRT